MPSDNSHSHAAGRQSFVIVFDFDHTVVNCNTDEVIPEALGRKELLHSLLATSMQFTTVCDTIIAPFTAAQLRQAAEKSVVVDPQMPLVFEFLKKLQEDQHTLLNVNIASDSNMLYIESSLDAHFPGVRPFISQIHTNAYEEVKEGKQTPGSLSDPMKGTETQRDATFSNGQTRHSRLFWYEAHQCRCCLEGGKPNMCKSRIIHRILKSSTLIDPTIIFIGDGRNDYCPVKHTLRPRDYVFARRGFPLHHELSSASNGFGCCHVKLWSDAAELLEHFRQVILRTPRLPSIVRFRDVHESEFRTASINKRVPNIFEQLLKKQPNAVKASTEGVQALISSLRENKSVPLLPGQQEVPQWLRNMVVLAEYDHPTPNSLPTSHKATEEAKEGACGALVAPRWGQLPWLHGEIYMYHLLWQWMLLQGENLSSWPSSCIGKSIREVSELLVNQISPYTIDNPLYSMQTTEQEGTSFARNLAVESSGTDVFDSTFLVHTPSSTLQGIQTKARQRQLFSEADAPHAHDTSFLSPTVTEGKTIDGVLPPHTFAPYRDIFLSDKKEVTAEFMKSRIVPMIACQPWRTSHGIKGETEEGGSSGTGVEEKDLALLPTVLRWMLWGNGVDLSMFTMKELTSERDGGNVKGKETHSSGATEAPHSSLPTDDAHQQQKEKETQEKTKWMAKCRQAEKRLMESMEHFLVGNETSALQAYLEHLVKGVAVPRDTPASEGDMAAITSNHVDIVCDNVGVELVADMLFALWFISHSTPTTTAHTHRPHPTVTFHVKPMPYYISDVTARDIALQLEWIEEALEAGGKTERDVSVPPSVHPYTAEEKACVKEFLSLVRQNFALEYFKVESELVWTQPNEYRELSPEVLNRYFYTQIVESSGTVPPSRSTAASGASSDESAHRRGGAGDEDEARTLYRENKNRIVPKTALVIFKGDLNYRRVVGDRHWSRTDFTTSLLSKGCDPSLFQALDAHDGLSKERKEVQQRVAPLLVDTPSRHLFDTPTFGDVVSAYWPTHCIPVCSIRTIKSECCVGVPGAVKKKLDDEKGFGWRVSGKYGEILIAS